MSINARGIVPAETAQLGPIPHIVHDVTVAFVQSINIGKVECLGGGAVTRVDNENMCAFR